MLELFLSILGQMIYLFSFIVIGFIVSKWKFVPENGAAVLSKLENIVFLPAAVMVTFINDCTIDKIADLWMMVVGAFALGLLLIPLSSFCARLCFKEDYVQKIASYGLTFSNFGYMGLAVMPAVFPEIELEYTIFTLPFWIMIYAWGAPVLLIGGSNNGEKVPLKTRLKSFVNPMLIGMLIGLIIGLTGLSKYIPKPISNVLVAGKNCMSPIAMLLTGMTIAKIDIIALIKKWRIYLVSIIKLLVYPLLFLLVFAFIPKNTFLNDTLLACAFCIMCMPMGLNGIVIPAGYGKDTTDAAGMALITHLLSILTIPVMFMLFCNVII